MGGRRSTGPLREGRISICALWSGPHAIHAEFFQQHGWLANRSCTPAASISRFRLLDTYLGLNLGNWQFSFGKNSLWWGPSEGGTMIFSDNAAPLNNMFTVNRVSPFRLPWLFRYLGDIRVEAFIGHMTGLPFQTTIYTGATTPTVHRAVWKELASGAVPQRRQDQPQADAEF